MKVTKCSVVTLCCCMLIGSSWARQSGPYLGQPNPGTTPVASAPTKIPPEAGGISFSPDGNECFHSQWFNGTDYIMTAKAINGVWSDAVVASFSGNSNDIEPHVVPDGKYLFFGSVGGIWWVDAKAITNLKPTG